MKLLQEGRLRLLLVGRFFLDLVEQLLVAGDAALALVVAKRVDRAPQPQAKERETGADLELLPVGEAVVLNALTRIPAAGVNAPGLLQITVAGVNQANATDLEDQFDGNSNFTTGTIQWTTLGIDTLKFLIPIRGC